MQEIKLQITSQKKSKKIIQNLHFDKSCQNNAIPLHRETRSNNFKKRTEYDGNFDYYRYGGKRIGLSLRWQEQYI